MGIGQVKQGNVSVSRMVLGGNPSSGFSHQCMRGIANAIYSGRDGTA